MSLEISWNNEKRKNQFEKWLQKIANKVDIDTQKIAVASADASFRRYFRCLSRDGLSSYIIMDSPPDKENNARFVEVAQLMAHANLKVPHILDMDESHGFMLLTDLGAKTALQALQSDQPQVKAQDFQNVFECAADSLILWQKSSAPNVLSNYDEALLLLELSRFTEWYLGVHKKIVLTADEDQMIQSTFAAIVQHNLSSAKVFVHRDFMLRNLMVGSGGLEKVKIEKLGVLDFQDAVYGPIAYDIASLVRDAFISFDEDVCLDVIARYWQKAKKEKLPVDDDFGEFYKAVEWMGLQRHLKIAGLFVRLTVRDGKPQYLADVPRFIQYIMQTCRRYRELFPFLRFIEKIENIQNDAAYAFGRV